jgi:hypothetical protein
VAAHEPDCGHFDAPGGAQTDPASSVPAEPTMTVTTSDPAGCPASSFSVTPGADVYPIMVPAGNTYSAANQIGSGTVQFNSTGNQNGCSGKTITLKATLP